MEPKEYWKSIRQMIEHEDTLINNRYFWMLFSQSLLFTALGVFWNKETLVEITICIVGIVFTASIGYTLFLAHRALAQLHIDWDKYSGDHDVNQIPPLSALGEKTYKQLLTWLIIPPIVCLAWIAILIWRLFDI